MNTIDGTESTVEHNEATYVEGDPRVSFFDVLATIALIGATVVTAYHTAQYWNFISPIQQLGGWLQNEWWNLFLWALATAACFFAWRTSDAHDEDIMDPDRPEDGGTMFYLFVLSLFMTIISFFA